MKTPLHVLSFLVGFHDDIFPESRTFEQYQIHHCDLQAQSAKCHFQGMYKQHRGENGHSLISADYCTVMQCIVHVFMGNERTRRCFEQSMM